MPDLSHFAQGLFEAHFAWGHFPYVLLILSMLMRDIVWLRSIAILAGVARVIIRAMIVYDPVAVFWETALVLVNVAQLLLIWWDTRHAHTNDDERLLVAKVLPDLPRRIARRLLSHAKWSDIASGSVLATEGRPVPELIFVTDGVARIEKNGTLVAICSKGDFVGEMSFIAGGGATATVVADKPMRVASFDRFRLSELLEQNPELRHALESSFNRNLIDKLTKASAPPAAPA